MQALNPLPLLSIVVPVRNEAANIAPLIAEIRASVAGIAHEIVYVDDGSTDETAANLRVEAGLAPLTVLRHRTGCGQSAAIITGVRAAAGEWIVTLDGDGQNDPADIAALFAHAQTLPATTLVAGHRTRRRDTRIKRASSRAANAIRGRMLGDATPDTGCGLKVFRRADFLELPAFDHMHRFLPALFIRAGGQVVSVPVAHRPRTRGASKYGTLDRLWVSIFDLVGVAWLQRRWTRPMLESPVLESPVLESPVLESPVLESPVLESPGQESPGPESAGPESAGLESAGLESAPAVMPPPKAKAALADMA